MFTMASSQQQAPPVQRKILQREFLNELHGLSKTQAASNPMGEEEFRKLTHDVMSEPESVDAFSRQIYHLSAQQRENLADLLNGAVNPHSAVTNPVTKSGHSQPHQPASGHHFNIPDTFVKYWQPVWIRTHPTETLVIGFFGFIVLRTVLFGMFWKNTYREYIELDQFQKKRADIIRAALKTVENDLASTNTNDKVKTARCVQMKEALVASLDSFDYHTDYFDMALVTGGLLTVIPWMMMLYNILFVNDSNKDNNLLSHSICVTVAAIVGLLDLMINIVILNNVIGKIRGALKRLSSKIVIANVVLSAVMCFCFTYLSVYGYVHHGRYVNQQVFLAQGPTAAF